MKAGKFGTLQMLAGEVLRQAESAQDVVMDTGKLTVETENKTPKLYSGTGVFGGQPIRTHAINQIGSHLGIHRAYLEKMRTKAPGLLDTNLNHWLHNQPSKRMIRSLDDNVRAFMSDKYKRIDNAPVLEAILPAIQEAGVEIKSCDVTENKLYLKVVSPRLEGEVKKGDFVQMGLVVGNSEIGLGSFFLWPLVYRLWCENGAISPMDFGEGIKRRHLGGRQAEGVLPSVDTLEAEARALALHARDAIRQLLSPETFQKHLKAFQETTERKITGKVPKAVEILGKTVGFTQDEGSGILRHLIEGGDLSQYGLINAVTLYAQDVDSYDRSTELEAIGGKIITLSPKAWKEVSEAA